MLIFIQEDRLAALFMAVTAYRRTYGNILRDLRRCERKLPRTAGEHRLSLSWAIRRSARFFWCIFITAVGLTCIFTIVGLVKNMIANNRNVSTIVGKFFLALLGAMAMLAVVILGILIANSFLQLLARIFQVNNTTKLSTAIFNACVGEWLNGYSASNIDVTSLTVGQILGGYNAALFGIWPTSWKCNGMVNPNSFLYLPALIAGIALAIALIMAVLNLAKRVYEIVFTYFTMPVAMSTLPLDDGARFKNWREMFVTKIILAYGAVFAVNIFVLILPIINGMHIDGVSGFCQCHVYDFYDRGRSNADTGRADVVRSAVWTGGRYACRRRVAAKRVLWRAHRKRNDSRVGCERYQRDFPCREKAQQ